MPETLHEQHEANGHGVLTAILFLETAPVSSVCSLSRVWTEGQHLE